MNKFRFSDFLKISLLLIISIIIIIPLLITLFASFKTFVQISNDFPLKPPNFTYINNYLVIFKRGGIPLGFLNSMILVVTGVILNTLLASMVSYCLSRFEFKLKKIFLLAFMIGMLVPTIVTEVARFGIINSLGMYNTLLAPIVIYAAADMMQIYIYIQFINKIPVSLDESAMIDGASYFKIFWKIIFPLVLPASATLAILKMVDIINDMYIPFLYMPSTKLHTLTTALMYFTGERNTFWNFLSAGIIVVMLPTIILYIIFQKFIFKGITAGAVKE
jgi:raffinose/stachyose/melibiose transport system permease protein